MEFISLLVEYSVSGSYFPALPTAVVSKRIHLSLLESLSCSKLVEHSDMKRYVALSRLEETKSSRIAANRKCYSCRFNSAAD